MGERFVGVEVRVEVGVVIFEPVLALFDGASVFTVLFEGIVLAGGKHMRRSGGM